MPIDNSGLMSILQAHFANVNAQHAQDQLDADKETAQGLLKLHNKQLDETAKQHQQDMDLRQAAFKMAMQNHYNELYGDTNPVQNPSPQFDFTGGTSAGSQDQSQLPSGIQDISQVAPNIGISDQSQTPKSPYQMQLEGAAGRAIPEGVTIDPYFRAKEAQRARQAMLLEAQGEGLKASAKEQAGMPRILAEIEGRQNVANTTQTGENTRAGLNRTSQEKIASGHDISAQTVENMRARSAMDVENARVAGQLATAKLSKSLDIDPDAIDAGVKDILNGGDPAKLPAKLRVGALSKINKMGYVVPDKAMGVILPSVKGVQDLLDEYEQTAAQFSRDRPGGSLISKASGGLFGGVVPGSELYGRLKDLESRGGQLATVYDQQKRKNDPEIKRAVVGNFDPKLTYAENMKNINSHRHGLSGMVLGTMHGIPKQQVSTTLNDNGIKLYSLKDTVTLKAPNGDVRTISKSDPLYQKAINNGATEVQ